MNRIIYGMDKELHDSINALKYQDNKDKFVSITKPEIKESDWKNFLESPPDNVSASVKEDLDELSSITRNITREQREIALRIDDKVESIFIDYTNQQKLKFPNKFVDELWKIYYPLVTNIKEYFNRARPYQLAPKYGLVVEPIITESSKTPSYPSGHSVYGYILENVLSEMYPLHLSKFQEISEQVGLSRKILGIHYQTDIVAARKLTNIIYPKLRNYLLTNNILYSD